MHFRKNNFIIHIFRVVNIFTISLAVTTGICFAQAKKATIGISQQSETQKIDINGYAVTEVVDMRDNKNFGRFLSSNGQQAPLILTEKPSTAFEKYVAKHYHFVDATKQIHINIKSLSLEETKTLGGGVNGKLSMQFSFEVIKSDDLYEHLVDYKANIKYTRLINQTKMPEQYLQEGFGKASVFFNDWFLKNKNDNALLAHSVILRFDDYKDDAEGDTIYYSPKRQLAWADFKDKPHYGKYAAEVIPGLGFTESNKVKDGVIVIDINLKVYLPKSAAWVKPGEENDVNLNHEQRHFDIVKIVGEKFKMRMLQEKLPVYNYDGYINVAYFDALREITALQQQYDHETIHGSDLAEQQRWNRKIDAELVVASSGSG